jgi:hypothetical protein
MNTNKYFKLIFLSLSLLIKPAFSIADWTVLIYVQAKNNLNRFAAMNLHSMSKIGSNQNLNILVQWYQPGQEGTWRYKIEKDKIQLDSYTPNKSDGSNTQDLVDSMRWATTKYPAKKNFLVLWNHGVGILDPVWNKTSSLGMGLKDNNIIENNFSVNIEDMKEKEDLHLKLDGILTEDFSFTQDFDPTILTHRGILFNEHSRTYLTNQELLEALKQIKTDVLKNKKLDILGMDACLMAMVEIGYQAKGFAKYMVGSQEVELAYGWDYLSLFQSTSKGVTSPIDMAKGIVLTFEQFYKNRIKFYTQSAIDLDNIDLVKDSLNNVVLKINECKKHDNTGIKNIIKLARNKSAQFSTRSYVDLHSFYSQLLEKINNYKSNNARINKPLKELKDGLNAGMKAITSIVIANTAGPNHAAAKGLSIYFPKGRIDNSYYQTNFAKESLWLDLIKDAYV